MNGRTLNLMRVPDDGWYRSEREYFYSENGVLWCNENDVRPLRLHYCEPSSDEPAGPIPRNVVRVVVDGVETPFVPRAEYGY